MTTPRLKVALPPADEQVPPDELAAPVRDRLAMERQRLDAIAPDALDVSASVLAVLHEELRGELAGLAADRTPRYRRGQLLGEHGLPLEDLAYLALRRPRQVARALRFLVEPSEGLSSGAGVAAAGAGLAEAGGVFCSNLFRALEDGRLTLAEIAQLERDLDRLENLVRDARAALVRRRP